MKVNHGPSKTYALGLIASPKSKTSNAFETLQPLNTRSQHLHHFTFEYLNSIPTLEYVQKTSAITKNYTKIIKNHALRASKHNASSFQFSMYSQPTISECAILPSLLLPKFTNPRFMIPIDPISFTRSNKQTKIKLKIKIKKIYHFETS